jgi:arylformamidase
MDAPTHFLSPAEAATIDDVGPDEMVTEGVILDFTDTGPNDRISKETLETEAERRGLQAGDVVVLDCGNPPRPTDSYVENYVTPSPAAAEYLVTRDVACVATDALGVDPPGASIAEHHIHRTLLPAGIRIIEGVDNLAAVDYGRHDVIATPIPYRGRDGAQIRLLVRPQ